MTSSYTPATIRRVRELAGRMPAVDIASDIGWEPARLTRLATAHGIDLAYRPMTSVTLLVPVSLVQSYAHRARGTDSSVEAEMVAALTRGGK